MAIRTAATQRVAAILGLLALLYGCSGGDYLPYSQHALPAYQIDALVSGASHDARVPVGLVRAVLMAESAGDPDALSRVGAQGLMQLMPGTAAACGLADPFDPTGNVECGANYLAAMLHRFHGNATLAVAAYNAGPGAVDRYHGVPPYPETRAYVARVISAYRSY